ncbi:hypothetical protein RHSIM_Rhsim11G0007900 [Rhododendron simsii]|uniref:Uncharacterized protein n=1 Tax=Rhododendron simsii TaxID=118357 RepID=A0A834G8M0_RHOSS|nr:hypothetical protein RHSIM_Rhsim11G0007900 [Rhododendron simsii]
MDEDTAAYDLEHLQARGDDPTTHNDINLMNQRFDQTLGGFQILTQRLDNMAPPPPAIVQEPGAAPNVPPPILLLDGAPAAAIAPTAHAYVVHTPQHPTIAGPSQAGLPSSSQLHGHLDEVPIVTITTPPVSCMDAGMTRTLDRLEEAMKITLTQELKQKDESFKEYVIRWWDLASQLETQISEKEAVRTFIYTMRGIFFDKPCSYVENQAEGDVSFEPLIASQPMQDNQDMDNAGTMNDDFVLDQESVNMIREDETDPRLLIGPPGMVVRGQKAIISGVERELCHRLCDRK